MSVGNSNDNQLPGSHLLGSADASIDSAETVRFLRRLSSFISVGQNAANLQDAANLIEALSHRAGEAERALREQDDKAATYLETCRAYETVLDRAQAEIVALNARLDQQAGAAAAERAAFEAEALRLSASVESAEAERAIAVADLDEPRAGLAALGEASVAVPVATLHTLRGQFEVLSEQFAANGDLISRVMSEIGRCAIDQIMVDHLPSPDDHDPAAPAHDEWALRA